MVLLLSGRSGGQSRQTRQIRQSPSVAGSRWAVPLRLHPVPLALLVSGGRRRAAAAALAESVQSAESALLPESALSAEPALSVGEESSGYGREREAEEALLMLRLFCDRALSACEAAADKTDGLRAALKKAIPEEISRLASSASGASGSQSASGSPSASRRRRVAAFGRSAEQERSCAMVKRLNELLHGKRRELIREIVGMAEARGSLAGSPSSPSSPSPASRARAVAARFEAGAAQDRAEGDAWYAAHPRVEIEYWKQQNRVCATVVGDLRRYAEDMRSVDES